MTTLAEMAWKSAQILQKQNAINESLSMIPIFNQALNKPKHTKTHEENSQQGEGKQNPEVSNRASDLLALIIAPSISMFLIAQNKKTDNWLKVVFMALFIFHLIMVHVRSPMPIENKI